MSAEAFVAVGLGCLAGLAAALLIALLLLVRGGRRE